MSDTIKLNMRNLTPGMTNQLASALSARREARRRTQVVYTLLVQRSGVDETAADSLLLFLESAHLWDLTENGTNSVRTLASEKSILAALDARGRARRCEDQLIHSFAIWLDIKRAETERLLILLERAAERGVLREMLDQCLAPPGFDWPKLAAAMKGQRGLRKGQR